MSIIPPYRAIAQQIEYGKVIIFLGAGASASGRSPNTQFKEGESSFPPLGRELAELLASDAGFPSFEEIERYNLPRVASYYEHVAVHRPALLDRLCEIFAPFYSPGIVHTYVAEVTRPLLIITTNYDDLIETAFKKQGRSFHLVVHPCDRKDLAGGGCWLPPGEKEFQVCAPNRLQLPLSDTPIIHKMHGSIDPSRDSHNHFLITEEDYVDFLAQMTINSPVPSCFQLAIRTSSFLFLGYSQRDWNFRVMLRNLKNYSNAKLAHGDTAERRSWAVQWQPTDVERDLWRSRNANVYDMHIDDFITQLRACSLLPQ